MRKTVVCGDCGCHVQLEPTGKRSDYKATCGNCGKTWYEGKKKK